MQLSWMWIKPLLYGLMAVETKVRLKRDKSKPEFGFGSFCAGLKYRQEVCFHRAEAIKGLTRSQGLSFW